MSSDRISESLQRDESIVRLQLQLQHALHRCAELELQVLNSRDHALIQAAELGGLKFKMERFIIDDKNHRAHIARLESALAEATSESTLLRRTVASWLRCAHQPRGKSDIRSCCQFAC